MSAHREELERVRAELKRLGYLDHGFERFLLQDALQERRAGRTVLSLALKVGVLAGALLALPGALALAVANGVLATAPFSLVPLYLHLCAPLSALAALAFAALSGGLALSLRWVPARRMEALCLGAAVAGGAGLLGLALLAGDELAAVATPWQRGALLVLAPVVAALVVRTLYDGLLSLAIALTDTAPRRLFTRRGLVVTVLLAALVLLVPGLLSAGRGTAVSAPRQLPTAPGERVLLMGIDGVLPEELDYLLARRELPALAALLGRGGVLAAYPREEGVVPAALWTSIATGRDRADHGVAAIDGFRPLGVAVPLYRTGPSRWFWSAVERPLGLVRHQPLLDSRRRAFAVWELAARGGSPVVAVNWWSTFPASPTPGLVLAHGAYQLLEEGVAGVAAPAERIGEMTRLRREVTAEPAIALGAGAPGLPADERDQLIARALAPDELYRRAVLRELAAEPRVVALYLPAMDIAAAGWDLGPLAFGDLLRSQLTAADRLIGEAAGGMGAVMVVVDPGRRRSAGEGRVLLWHGEGCAAAEPLPRVDPRAVAAGLLRALGLPQSSELPDPPGVCSWPAAAAQVGGYGERSNLPAENLSSSEYLQSLRALGYL